MFITHFMGKKTQRIMGNLMEEFEQDDGKKGYTNKKSNPIDLPGWQKNRRDNDMENIYDTKIILSPSRKMEQKSKENDIADDFGLKTPY
jgi:hypothetical protein